MPNKQVLTTGQAKKIRTSEKWRKIGVEKVRVMEKKTENNRNNSILELMANYHGNLYS